MGAPVTFPQKLIDRFGRTVDYVRLSVTDRCDFRCVYCMEEDTQFLPRKQVLTLEEIVQIGRAFAELGVRKIRITGGEPLVRRDIMWLMRELGQLPLRELVLTTNGSQLARYAQELKAANVQRLNISIDSLKPDRFRAITRKGDLDVVLAGLAAAQAAGFARIKLNTVILKNRNDDEVLDLVKFAITNDLDISFIEEMPLGINTDHDRAEVYYSSDDIRRDLQREFTLIPTTETTGGPAKYFRLAGHAIKVGFISPHSHNFCHLCNRVRVTVEGRLLLCLGQEHSVDLRAVLRAQPEDTDALKHVIVQAMEIKPQGHDFHLQQTQPIIFRHMNVTGG